MPPLLVIGTKLDSAQSLRSSSNCLKTTSQIALNFRADEINLVGFGADILSIKDYELSYN